MTDPKRSPIAALLPKWKEWADNLERDARTIAISRSLNTPDCECEDWRENELGCQAVRLRQCCRELEAAIAETAAQLAERTRERDSAKAIAAEWLTQAQDLGKLAEERLVHANQLQSDIEADQLGRLELRKRFGADPDETMGMFVARLAKERDDARAENERLREALDEREADVPEERLREARRAVIVRWNGGTTHADGKLLDELERVDAEFAKGESGG